MVARPTTATAEQVTTARAAAAALADHLPSAVPLAVVDDAARPSPDDVAVHASFVGAVSANLVVVADQAVAEALAGDAPLSLADALRPALEAAAAVLGPGVLAEARTGTVADVLGADDVVTVALAPSEATAPTAWFALRVRTTPTPDVPQQRTVTVDQRAAFRLLHDVEMTLTAEIGRTRLPVRQVLELVPGTVLELDRAAGSPADVMVNGRLVARGEVVVVDEDYGIRITEIVAAERA